MHIFQDIARIPAPTLYVASVVPLFYARLSTMLPSLTPKTYKLRRRFGLNRLYAPPKFCKNLLTVSKVKMRGRTHRSRNYVLKIMV